MGEIPNQRPSVSSGLLMKNFNIIAIIWMRFGQGRFRAIVCVCAFGQKVERLIYALRPFGHLEMTNLTHTTYIILYYIWNRGVIGGLRTEPLYLRSLDLDESHWLPNIFEEGWLCLIFGKPLRLIAAKLLLLPIKKRSPSWCPNVARTAPSPSPLRGSQKRNPIN